MPHTNTDGGFSPGKTSQFAPSAAATLTHRVDGPEAPSQSNAPPKIPDEEAAYSAPATKNHPPPARTHHQEDYHLQRDLSQPTSRTSHPSYTDYLDDENEEDDDAGFDKA